MNAYWNKNAYIVPKYTALAALFHHWVTKENNYHVATVSLQYHICLSSVSACLFICSIALYLDLLPKGVGLLSLVSIISVCRLFLLVFYLLHVSLPGFPGWICRSAVCVQYHISLSSVSVCLFICWMALYLDLLVEGVGLLSLFCSISVFRLFLLVSLSVTWLSTWISWLKESGCCLDG